MPPEQHDPLTSTATASSSPTRDPASDKHRKRHHSQQQQQQQQPQSRGHAMQIKRRLSHREDGGGGDDDDGDTERYDDRRRRRRYKRIRVSPDNTVASRPPSRDIISTLPPELLVRILSYLGETTLLEISTVSRLFHRITSDHQLWRHHYYRRFILPRAHLIPGFRKSGCKTAGAGLGSAGAGRWSTSRPEPTTDRSTGCVDWKKSYKLLHNWARGRCDVGEVQLHPRERMSLGKTLVKVVEGLAITADATSGLLVWDLRTRAPLVQTGLDLDGDRGDVRPTCLAVDDERLALRELGVAVGFEDGTFGVWRMDLDKRQPVQICHRDRGPYGELEAVAYCHPYLLAAATSGSISLWSLDQPRRVDSDKGMDDAVRVPCMLRSLKSHSTRPPLTLSVRRVSSSVVASIAYTLDTVGGWCIGIQDLDIRPSPNHALPEIIDSRIAHTIPTSTRGSGSSTPSSSPPSSPGCPARDHHHHHHPDGPIRLCYSHPYLLATLPDNTLLLHLCTTTPSALTISPGIRLWGHTSGISDAEITTRGKAVSVSARGDEIRVWELEGRMGGSSVEVRPRQHGEHGVASSAWAMSMSPTVMDYRRNKVGFDDEMVIVLKETLDGRESLMVYDFT
ncbi:F-box protein-like protein [Hapsidospora chrysogenum ATCC 11550]|uniref:F-box protein-like protein n=1 Tax=Hapsidospora chrysogenum (strain ATCC 11550 / CBS 779.69 / DSM 880 / IAM 14645 / JCM 23072 / IMI 49137) TaxID=857340 RepID=A0A086SZL3_HAPC1|nr:F-box protein-like protein [Hapsidospora chrysogenum ATCC 11550]